MRKVSGSALAELTGKTWRTCKGLLEQSGVRPTREGRADLYESDVALRAIYAPDSTSTSFDPNQERARKDAESADKLAMENAVRRGELVEGAIVAAAFSDEITRARARLLQVPDAVAQQFDTKTGALVATEVRRLIYEALAELTGGVGRVGPDDSGPVGAPARANGQRVGGPIPKPVERK